MPPSTPTNNNACTAFALLEPEPATKAEQRRALKAAFSSYMTANDARAAEQVAALAARLSATPAEARSPLDALILRLHAHFPGDRGLMGPLFLNYLRLGPGQAFVMEANEPHAYLSGDILECMACSDNVVRVGLTPKYRDVPTLLEMLTYK
jgi:mannose-6-phosphate isomerase